MVTGASKGIGASIAERLGAEGGSRARYWFWPVASVSRSRTR